MGVGEGVGVGGAGVGVGAGGSDCVVGRCAGGAVVGRGVGNGGAVGAAVVADVGDCEEASVDVGVGDGVGSIVVELGMLAARAVGEDIIALEVAAVATGVVSSTARIESPQPDRSSMANKHPSASSACLLTPPPRRWEAE
jgi:hypothetical protein